MSSFGYSWVNWVGTRCLPINYGSRGFNLARYVSSGSFGFTLVQSGAPSGHRVHSGWRRTIHALISVVGSIRVGEDSLTRNLESSGTFGFALIHSDTPRGCLVHSRFTQVRLGVIGFVRDRVGSHERA